MKKTSFHRKSDEEKKSHVRFVISNPDPENMVLVVNMTTFRGTGREDLSCILNTEDHKRVKHKSYIFYAKAEELSTIQILKLKFEGLIDIVEDLSDEVLNRIQEGAKASDFLPEKFYKYFEYF